MKDIPYKSFPNFVLRTPLFPVNFFKQLTSNETISNEDFKIALKDPVIQEALFLASPSLFKALQRWLQVEIKDPKKEEKLKNSLLKYLSRTSSRCTPFGLFAGCTIGEIDNKTKVSLGKVTNNSRHTRLDMNYLVALSQDLTKEKNIKEQLLFFPNSSIYRVGSQFRYVEYHYKDTKRHHNIVAVDYSEYLDFTLETAKNGLRLKELTQCIASKGIDAEEASIFIEDLIDNQLLISELEPSVSGPDFLGQIVQVLSKLTGVEHILFILKNVQDRLESLDKNIGNPVDSYIMISNQLKELHTTFNLKHLFQTDMFINAKTAKINKSVIDSVKKGVYLLNKISLPPKETFLSKFKDAFYERFEEREIPLSKALDVEMGVGYLQNMESGEINPLIDNLILPRTKRNTTQDIKWSLVDSIFQKKLLCAIAKKETTIEITDKDFKDFNENWGDLPDTISTMVKVVSVGGKQKIKFDNIAGASAANLLGRFCHGNKKIYNHAKEIVNFEMQANKEKLLAEIVHLPESRTGNILMRPTLRTFEIPYLAKSVLPKENQIQIEDLTVSIKNGSVLLKSEKLKKEVVPHLTNAHNYAFNALPVYQFLCDMQTKNKRGFLGINLGPFSNEYDFIPRIEYRDLILFEATWNFKKISFSALFESIESEDKFKEELEGFKKRYSIPQFVLLPDGDNELLINFDNITSVKMLLQTVKNRESFSLKEFLFSESGFAKSKDNNKYFTNEVILSFYNDNKA